MAATVWKGFLTFGLISIPVRLFTAARPERISFNQLSKKTHARLKQQLIDPTTGEVVERSDIVKGYAVGKDQYVLVDDEEIKKVQPASGDRGSGQEALLSAGRHDAEVGLRRRGEGQHAPA
jgi:DNA end-binding protein Ku